MTAVTDDADTPLTHAAYAARIGTSRPYVSGLKAKGILHGPAFTPDGKIIPRIADQQRADYATTAAREPATARPPAEGTYARERALLTAAQRERADMENAVRRGELIPRSAAAAVIPAAARRYRDTLAQRVRDRITSDIERAALLDDIAAATEQFITEALITDGGAPPPAA